MASAALTALHRVTPVPFVIFGVFLFWTLVSVLVQDFFLRVTFDDSYYYFGVARNFVLGRGFTFDGLNQTNGFHPLWLFLCALPYSLNIDSVSSVRLLLLLQILLSAGGCLLLFAGMRTYRLHPLTSLLTALLLLSPSLIRVTINGMESALLFSFLSLFIYLHLSGLLDAVCERGAWKKRLVLGCVLGFLFLCRTDCGIFLPLYFVWVFSQSNLSAREKGTAAVQILWFPTLVVCTFLWWNLSTFGTPLQVSGQVKETERTLLNVLGFFICVAATHLLVQRLAKQRTFRSLQLLTEKLRVYFYYGGTLVGYYLFLQHFPRLWHFAPVILLGALAYLFFASDMLSLLSSKESNKKSERALVYTSLFLPALLCIGLGWKTFTDPRSYATRVANFQAAQWIKENTPTDDVFVSWDAGIIGYFSMRTVINLDGVINSFQYLKALKAGRTDTFLKAFQIRWLVNHDEFGEQGSRNLSGRARELLGSQADSMILRKKWPFQYYGGLNNETFGFHAFAVFLYEFEEKREAMNESGFILGAQGITSSASFASAR